MATAASQSDLAPASIRLPGILLGLGLGGFIDGILLHQILQWHHLLTGTDDDNIGVRYYDPETVPGLQMNTVWDGIFHALCWLFVLFGLGVLYSRVTHHRRRVWSSRVLWGWIIAGWGLFNLVEGIVDHHILRVHHVRSGPHELWWDIGFLVLGAILFAGGWLLQRSGNAVEPDAAPSRPTRRRT